MTEMGVSLYEQLGGEKMIDRLVDEFYDRISTDPELAIFCQNDSVEDLKTMQKVFFSEALGGPVHYSRCAIREIQEDRGIQRHHIMRFGGHLLDTLASNHEELGIQISDVDKIYQVVVEQLHKIVAGKAS